MTKRQEKEFVESKTKVYLIDLDLLPGLGYEEINQHTPDAIFIALAESQGFVYTLGGFASNFNREDIPLNSFIRFVVS